MKEIKRLLHQFLSLPGRVRLQKIRELLDFFIAGEDTNKLLLFFLLLGNYHDDLHSLILYRGDPSSGKSFVVQNVLKLFPTEHVYILDSATAQALHYDPDLDGKKILFLRELKEQQSLVEFLKGFFDENMIHKETVKDFKTKEQITKTHIHERMGIVTTFSFENIQQDLIERSWVLTPDEKHEQTKRIIDFTLENETGLIERKVKEKSIDTKCYMISQVIRYMDFEYTVYIGFLDKIKGLFPYEYLNVRRDVKKLLQIIKIVTIWNQKNRRMIEIDNVRILFAEYEDLEIALEVCEDLFINLVLHVDKIKRAILDFMVDYETVVVPGKLNISSFASGSHTQETKKEIEQDKMYTITEVFEDLRDDMGVSRRTVQRKLNDLFYDGYVVRVKPKNTYLYSKKRNYNIIEAINLPDMKEEINDLVDQKYIFYANKTEEILDDGD